MATSDAEEDFVTIQSLTPPQDITWTRLSFARDMIDTNFGDLAFPPKWRTSLAVYYYIVPEEEVADAYPESRIVYLPAPSRSTGWPRGRRPRCAMRASSVRPPRS